MMAKMRSNGNKLFWLGLFGVDVECPGWSPKRGNRVDDLGQIIVII